MRANTETSWIVVLVFILVGIGISTCAHATSLVLGVGRATYAWCGPSGCWKQEPLPYHDKRTVTTSMFGLRFPMSHNIDIDLLRHDFRIASAGGTYVADDDYHPATHHVKDGASTSEVALAAKTEGHSLSLSPHYPIGALELRGRAGIFAYKQTVEFFNGFREVGHRSTWLAGVGLDYPVGRSTFGIEYDLFGIVKIKDSPVGGWESSRAGIKQIMGTYSYRF